MKIVEYKAYVDGAWFMSFHDPKAESVPHAKWQAEFIAEFCIGREVGVTDLKLKDKVFSFKSNGHKFVVEMC
jgi:hypothetical protein